MDVSRREARVRESGGNPENMMKLEAAEAKLQELKSNMTTLGKEAASALAAVEGQQQRLTVQRLIAMVSKSFFLTLLLAAFVSVQSDLEILAEFFYIVK